VRTLAIEDRAPLLDASNSAWKAAFASYLILCGCPLLDDASNFDSAQCQSYVQWLVGHAIAMLFEDKCKRLAMAPLPGQRSSFTSQPKRSIRIHS